MWGRCVQITTVFFPAHTIADVSYFFTPPSVSHLQTHSKALVKIALSMKKPLLVYFNLTIWNPWQIFMFLAFSLHLLLRCEQLSRTVNRQSLNVGNTYCICKYILLRLLYPKLQSKTVWNKLSHTNCIINITTHRHNDASTVKCKRESHDNETYKWNISNATEL